MPMTKAEQKRRAKIRRIKKLLVISIALVMTVASICVIYTAGRLIVDTGANVSQYESLQSGNTDATFLGQNPRPSNQQNSSAASPTDYMGLPLDSPRRDFLETEEIPMILQNPELPTGCEATAVTMLLQAYGYSVDKLELADSLPRAEILTIEDRKYITHPEEGFVGNPRSSGYGVFSPAIAETAQLFIDRENGTDRAIALKGKTEEDILYLIDEGFPVCIWATMENQEVAYRTFWYILRDGKPTEELFTWPGNEHCLVLVGYTEQTVSVMDPLEGMVTYPRDDFFRHYEDVGSYALVIV